MSVTGIPDEGALATCPRCGNDAPIDKRARIDQHGTDGKPCGGVGSLPGYPVRQRPALADGVGEELSTLENALTHVSSARDVGWLYEAALGAIRSREDRKGAGSYYTPPDLVEALLDSALEPVLDAAVKGEDV